MIFSLFNPCTDICGQIQESRIEGHFTVYHPQDTSSFFVGNQTGRMFNPSIASHNSILGNLGGFYLTNGKFNSFFGSLAGFSIQTGINNTGVGYRSGPIISTGSSNSFFGSESGRNVTGSNNICLGYQASPSFGKGVESNRLYIDVVTSDEPLIYGEFDNDLVQINGELVMGNTNHFAEGDDGVIRSSSLSGSDLFLIANDAVIIEIGDKPFEDGTFEVWNRTNEDKLLTLNESGELGVKALGTGGNVDVYWNNSTGHFSISSSSIRYKDEVEKYTSGLDIISRLQPVTFRWKESDEKDFGLIAEEVVEIEPLLVTYNNEEEVEGVKYDQVALVLLNAVKEQQVMIEELREENDILKIGLKKQSEEIDKLKALIAPAVNYLKRKMNQP